MSPEEKELLHTSVELAKENNKILRSIRNSMRWARVFKAIYWLVIIGSTIGIYYYVQPYVEQFQGAVDSTKNNLDNLNNLIKNFGR